MHRSCQTLIPCLASSIELHLRLPALLTQIISPPALGTVCSAQTHFKEAALQQECFKKYNISICYSNSLCCGSLLMDYLPFFAPVRYKKILKQQALGAGRQCLTGPVPLLFCTSVLLQGGRCRQGSSFSLKAVKPSLISAWRTNSTCLWLKAQAEEGTGCWALGAELPQHWGHPQHPSAPHKPQQPLPCCQLSPIWKQIMGWERGKQAESCRTALAGEAKSSSTTGTESSDSRAQVLCREMCHGQRGQSKLWVRAP